MKKIKTLLVTTSLAFCAAGLNAQVPSSIAGIAIETVITNGVSPFPSSGSSRILPSASDNSYGLVALSGPVSSSYGTYSYSKSDEWNATLSVADVVQGPAVVAIHAITATTGTFRTTSINAPGASQSGTYRLYNGQAPDSIQGRTFQGAIQAGASPFASSGSFQLVTSIADNTYQIIGGPGVSNSFGTYTYTKVSQTACTLNLTDSVLGKTYIETLSWDTSSKAAYAARSSSSGGYQAGTLTAAADCTAVLSATNATYSISGGGSTFRLTLPDTCWWEAKANASWLQVSPSSGYGSATIYYTVNGNSSGPARTGTISVNDKTFTVAQAGNVPVFTQQPASQSALAGATVYLTAAATGSGLAWVWQKDGVTVADGGHYTGVYTPSLVIHGAAAADVGNYSVWVGNAAAWIKSSNATLTVCSYSLASASTNFASGGGSGTVAVNVSAGCTWAASANVSWLHTASSGAGNGTVAFTVDSNASVTARSGAITVEGQTFTVNQAGLVCAFALSPASARFGTNGGAGAVVISNPCGGSWTATNNGAAWITIISGSSGVVTPGTVNYQVAPNYTGRPRSANLTVGGISFGVSQGPFKSGSDLDFDGDGKADITVYDPVPGDWYVRLSSGGSNSFRWGGGSMVPVHGDFDGDGKSDRAVYYPDTGQWYLTLSGGGMKAVRWGNKSAVPMPADYDGDGKTDCCVWETNAGDWYIPYSSGGSTTIRWGWKGTVPLTGDFDGDGKADIVNYDPKPGDWYLRCANGSMSKFNWGGGAMVPMVGDFNGDGKADAAVYYAADGVFYIRYSGGGMGSIKWAGGNMKPVLADFDGDGKTDIAAYDAPGGAWYIRYATGVMKMVKWGWSEAVAP